MGGLAQNVQKTPPGKNVQKFQGQIFQECQGQISQGQIFQECQGQISQGQIFQESQGQISQGQMGNRKKPEKWESVTKIKKP